MASQISDSEAHVKSELACGELETTESDTCPVCDAQGATCSLLIPDYLHGVPGVFSYVRCTTCRTVFQNPRVADADLGKCYPGSYFTHALPGTRFGATLPQDGTWRGQLRRAILHAADGSPALGIPQRMKLLGHLLALLPALRRRARYGLPDVLGTPGKQRCLEVGPGQGLTLAQLARLGWSAEGLDIDPQAAATAAEYSGCRVHVGTITSVAIQPASLNMIYMNHVVEHLPDIAPALRRCYNLLAPGGRLVLCYPNPESLGIRFDGKFSANWDPPRHLVLPPGDALAELLRRIGFSGVQYGTLARCAAVYRAVARQYRQGRVGVGFQYAPNVIDVLFSFLEHAFVAMGAQVGEEVSILAFKK
jgi:SAM-dependent methyltransferase